MKDLDIKNIWTEIKITYIMIKNKAQNKVIIPI